MESVAKLHQMQAKNRASPQMETPPNKTTDTLRLAAGGIWEATQLQPDITSPFAVPSMSLTHTLCERHISGTLFFWQYSAFLFFFKLSWGSKLFDLVVAAVTLGAFNKLLIWINLLAKISTKVAGKGLL